MPRTHRTAGYQGSTRRGGNLTGASIGSGADSNLPRALRNLQLRSAISNLTSRIEFANRAGISYTGKRDTYATLGYKRNLLFKDYYDRFRRDGLAKRIVSIYPSACWGGLSVFEDEDVKVTTQFESDIEQLFARLGVAAKLKQTDINAGIGEFACLFIGVNDGLEFDQAIRNGSLKGKGQEAILYLTPLLQEENVKVKELVGDSGNVIDRANPRYGLPLYYDVQFSRSSAIGGTSISNRVVHYSRMLHVTRNSISDPVYGLPELEDVWNDLDDIRKNDGGGSEANWRRMDPGVHADVDPTTEFLNSEGDLLTDEQIGDEIKGQWDNYVHGLERLMITRGTKLTPLTPGIVNFGPNVQAKIEQICATKGVPYRIFMGSERGELASSQDRDNWEDRKGEYRDEHCTPVTRDLVDRLILWGAVSSPKNTAEYQVAFDIKEKSIEDKAALILNLGKANQAQALANGEVFVTADEVRDLVLEMEPLPANAKGKDKSESAPSPDNTSGDTTPTEQVQ